MVSVQKWKWSWTLVAAVASLLALVSVVHMFLVPVVPSLESFSVRQVQSPCASVNESVQGGKHHVWDDLGNLDLVNRFPADLHTAVVYRNAPWKAEIGRWLSGCDAIAEDVSIVEVLTTCCCSGLIHACSVVVCSV